MARRRISNKDFVHTHCHTEYSSFDGLNKISNLPMLARKMGFPALAITDHGTIGGAIKFMQECMKTKDKDGKEIPHPTIKPIIGCEMYLSRNRFSRTKDEQPDMRRGNRHLVLLAKNWEGYQNLCSLSQASWIEGYGFMSPRIDFDLLEKHHKGLICSSACLSSVINSNLLNDRYDKAKIAATKFKDLFGDDFYLEVMYHGIDAEGAIIPDVKRLGEELGIKILASNDSHYGTKDMGKSHELLMAMSTSKCLHDPKHLHFPYDEFYLKSAAEMAVVFGSQPDWLLNTREIADKIDSEGIYSNMNGGMRLPKFEVPKEFNSPFDYMVHLADDGMKKLGWDKSERHVDRLTMEINDVRVALDVNNYDFTTYFLIVRDYIKEAESRGILVGAGRGSGYGSVLLRALEIAYGPDPIDLGLLWERFLGFDDIYSISERDFGFEAKKEIPVVASTDVIDEARAVEDDLGGVDRY
jgi:DNA polymerase-3 subunit alpha